MSKPNIGILFVHGIQGKPEQFTFLEQVLPENVRKINTLLPGHGASLREFRRAGMQEWLSSVKAQAEELCQSCDQVFFVGHSMGCLLGLLAAATPGISFAGMLLLCCPFSIRPTLRYFRNNMLAIKTKGQTNDPFVKATWEANSVAADHAIAYITCPRPYLHLLRLIHQARKLVLHAHRPKHFFFSERDEIVSLNSAKKADAFPPASVQVLSGCGHNYFTTEARQAMQSSILNMLNMNQHE